MSTRGDGGSQRELEDGRALIELDETLCLMFTSKNINENLLLKGENAVCSL